MRGGLEWALIALAACGCRAMAAVELRVDLAGAVTRIDPHLLTAVTIDVCALKQQLNFSDPTFVALAANLAPTVLRIGGTDQNSFKYNMSDRGEMAACECGHECVMNAPYWDGVNAFLDRTGLSLLFGLSPASPDNANELIQYTADHKFSSVRAYSYGNEVTGDAQLAARYLRDMTAVRTALEAAYHKTAIPRPLLVGADTGVGPRRDTLPFNFWTDEYINEHLAWIKLFVKTCHSVLDAVTWHTYDYRASEIGTADHEPLPWPPTNPNVSKLWDSQYLEVGAKLADNVSTMVAEAGAGHLPVWLTETNAVCHQGVYNDTNAFLNSLWLVNRLGLMAVRGVPFMARQSLIGFNYSLLGNYPYEPLRPHPDYFTTVLYRTLIGNGSIGTTVGTVGRAPSAPSTLEGYSYCGRGGGVVLTLVSLDEDGAQSVAVPTALQSGRRDDYTLTPHWKGDPSAPARDKVTSQVMELNGEVLDVGPDGAVPAMAGRAAGPGDKASVSVPPLSIVFAAFPDAVADGC